MYLHRNMDYFNAIAICCNCNSFFFSLQLWCYRTSSHLRRDTMLHLLRLLSALILVMSCLKWPSTTYATPDRCRLPAPNDIYGCPYPRRVYYNTPQGQCVPYAYCGAAGSMYGFETWEECERVCGMRGGKMDTYTGKFSFCAVCAKFSS